ncbi:ATP-binding protein [Kitasatospora sp. NPDC097643]|uniref:ATP-binding protein n=1 Tax=Kitasatospora sp. NPDC097643 TaxID=3157230 RepID=UPI00331CB9E6
MCVVPLLATPPPRPSPSPASPASPPASPPTDQHPGPRCAEVYRLVWWTLDPAAAAVPEVRRLLAEVLPTWRIAAELADTLLLAASELVTNAVTHAAGVTAQIGVTLGLGRGRLQLEVSDSHPHCPPLPPRGGTHALDDAEAEGGRGLWIVHTAVTAADGRLDVLPGRVGKTLRIRVPV